MGYGANEVYDEWSQFHKDKSTLLPAITTAAARNQGMVKAFGVDGVERWTVHAASQPYPVGHVVGAGESKEGFVQPNNDSTVLDETITRRPQELCMTALGDAPHPVSALPAWYCLASAMCTYPQAPLLVT